MGKQVEGRTGQVIKVIYAPRKGRIIKRTVMEFGNTPPPDMPSPTEEQIRSLTEQTGVRVNNTLPHRIYRRHHK